MNTIYKNHLKNLLIATITIASISSCKKDRPADADREPVISGTKGIYVLGEGTWGMNNSSIAYYDIVTGQSDMDRYKTVNGTALGETATDLKSYGSKMYCVVSGLQDQAKSFVDIIDVATCKSLKRLSFNTATSGAMPRYVTFYKNKAYVSRYDGKISRIDTGSLAIDGELQLINGVNNAGGLEGVAVANGKLYVANSAHSFYPNGLKTKVTVIDLSTFKKLKDIEVGSNPVRISAAGNGDLYVMTWNDYVTFNDPTLVRINSVTDAVIQTEKYDLGAISIVNDQAWATQDVYSNATIKSINLTTGKLAGELITDGTKITTLYGLTVNSFDKSVLVADGNNYGPSGKAFVFDADGKKKFEFTTGPLPQNAVFVYKYR